MSDQHGYTLTVAAVAAHYRLTPRTVRERLMAGDLAGMRIGGQWRCRWADIWAAEKGPMPKGARGNAYRQPLLTKRDLAAQWSISERTVERWITAGLPTRQSHKGPPTYIGVLFADLFAKPPETAPTSAICLTAHGLAGHGHLACPART